MQQHSYTLNALCSSKSSDKSPLKDASKEDTEFSPIKKPKKAPKKVIEDSDEEEGTANTKDKDVDNEKKSLNGHTQEYGEKSNEKSSPVTKQATSLPKPSCSASSDDDIPKRKTGGCLVWMWCRCISSLLQNETVMCW